MLLCAFTALSLLPSSCSKDPIRQKIIDPDTTRAANYENGIFIINEGNFNWGNASVTYLDNASNHVFQDVFAKSNSRSLGDVAESMTIVNGLGYLVINNSNRIEVVSLKDFKSVKTIEGLHLPRFLQVIDSNKAYVTNLLNSISIIDLKTNMVTKAIQTNSWTENLVRYNKCVFVTSIGSFNKPSSQRNAQILVIDIGTDAVVDSIQTGKEPIGLVLDKYQKLWALCSGGYDNYEAPALLRINPDLRIVEKEFTFPNLQEVPGRLCINPTGDTIYFLKGGVFQMPVLSQTLPGQALINDDGRLFYGLNINPVSGYIYVSDAKDYVQNGTAFQYTVHGNLITHYATGRIPGSFCFTRGAIR